MNIIPKIGLLTLAVLLTTNAPAQNAAPRPAAKRNASELAVAQADLERAARRVAELSRGAGQQEIGIERRIPRRPMIGVLLAPDSTAGVRIAGVTPNGPAARAGMRSGDRLVAIGGHQILGTDGDLRVANVRALLDKVDAKKPVQLKYVRDGRTTAVNVVPSLSERVPTYAFVNPDGSTSEALGDVLFDHDDDGAKRITARAFHVSPPGVAPQIRREIIRVGPGNCDGEDCQLPFLAEAFRWNGLNLASVDPQLGRYFGTDSGVLVLSSGKALPGLQAGDVLRRIDGRPVRSPREAMAALHAHAPGSSVSVEVLRDRKTTTMSVKVPRALPLRMPVPPAPPPAPRAPAAPPPPPAPPAVGEFVFPEDGDLLALAPPPPPAPPAPVWFDEEED